jgi:hypothetical protein
MDDVQTIKSFLPEINRVVSKALGSQVRFTDAIRGQSFGGETFVKLVTAPSNKNLGVFKSVIKDYQIVIDMFDLRNTRERKAGEHTYDFNGGIEFRYNHPDYGSNGYRTNIIVVIQGGRVSIVKRRQ